LCYSQWSLVFGLAVPSSFSFLSSQEADRCLNGSISELGLYSLSGSINQYFILDYILCSWGVTAAAAAASNPNLQLHHDLLKKIRPWRCQSIHGKQSFEKTTSIEAESQADL
jgi:hypothetical protein